MLRAIDDGVAFASMSDRAFDEIGRTCWGSFMPWRVGQRLAARGQRASEAISLSCGVARVCTGPSLH